MSHFPLWHVLLPGTPRVRSSVLFSSDRMAGSTQALSLVMCLAFFSQEKMCAQAFTTHLKKTAPVVRHRQQHELLSTARGGAPPVDSDSSKLLAMIKDQTTTASSPASHDSDRGNEWKKGCLRRSRRSRWRYALDVSAGVS